MIFFPIYDEFFLFVCAASTMFPTDGGKPNAVPVKMSEAQQNKKKSEKSAHSACR